VSIGFGERDVSFKRFFPCLCGGGGICRLRDVEVGIHVLVALFVVGERGVPAVSFWGVAVQGRVGKKKDIIDEIVLLI
jgi:hypothetical protein